MGFELELANVIDQLDVVLSGTNCVQPNVLPVVGSETTICKLGTLCPSMVIKEYSQ